MATLRTRLLRMPDLIAKKRDGEAHRKEEIEFISEGAARGTVPDYQLSAWLMAALLRGLSREETVLLTSAMARSGPRLDLSRLKAAKVDKHSTGGVGDGISIALAPLVASGGLYVPMMSGRGLGHTGGTLDKLESIQGFRVRMTLKEVEAQVSRIGVCMFGQTEELAPADRKLYALRDATATVQSIQLIVGSILSKKLAEDLDGLVLDVKCGSGAIFQEASRAEVLAKELIRTAHGLGMKCVGLLTAMEQPLGLLIGTSLEVRQALEVLHGDFRAADYVEVLLALGGWMMHFGGKARSPEQGAELCRRLIRQGAALARFKEMVRAQGGDPRVADSPDRLLPKAGRSLSVKAPSKGFLARLDARCAGRAAVALGAGRDRMEDSIDYGAGIELCRKVGDAVAAGDEIARLYAGDPARLREGHRIFSEGVGVSPKRAKASPVILRVVR
jgi:pyrimidine-nucleoside phosphorylase